LNVTELPEFAYKIALLYVTIDLVDPNQVLALNPPP
jgi:hypothetical protein